ncbi:MAG: hypothetical protein AAGB04_26430 [Pseudomonadota bacterium]
MGLTKPPALLTFLVALAVGILALVSHLGIAVPELTNYSFWVMTAAYVLLVMGCLFRGL